MIFLDQILSTLNLEKNFGTHKSFFFDKLTSDTRLFEKSHLFIAVPGENFSTDALIQKAIAVGARFIVAQKTHIPVSEAVVLSVNDIHQTKYDLCQLFYPSHPKYRIAVTGTSGKTSTIYFFRQLCAMQDLRVATIGTLGVQSTHPLAIDYNFEPMTTPHATLFYELLNACNAQRIHHIAFEATSHALAQQRLGPFQVEIGIFTNLSHDHLDYHKTIQAYGQAKKKLFSDHIVPGGTAILHYELPFLEELTALCRTKDLQVIYYGQNQQDASYTRLSFDETKQHVRFHVLGYTWEDVIPLIGVFQIDNLLAALTAFIVLGGNPAALSLQTLESVPGRLQYAGQTLQGSRIYVDFSHKPGALEKALVQLRPFVKKKLGVVFGCGGERDRGKRKMMGEIAARNSDWIIITDDNPRYEDAASIRQEILQGCPQAEEYSPREMALYQAIKKLQAGDILLVAGKGPETTQVIGHHHVEFSDLDWVEKILKNLDSEPL